MQKTRSLYLLAVASALLISAVSAFAHNGMEHVMGTISKLSGSTVTVETIQHKTVLVLLDPATQFIRNEVRSSLQNLHVGDRVVIHAKLNATKQLVGITIKWGAASASHPDRAPAQ
jgi:energy-coupling factor transporter ATP-binding protein EcfA2